MIESSVNYLSTHLSENKWQKLLFYPIYLFYLYLADFLYPTLVVLPLLFLLINFDTKKRNIILILFFIFDVSLSGMSITPFKNIQLTSLYYQVHPAFSTEWKWLLPLVSLLSLFILTGLSFVLSYLRKLKTYLVIPFYAVLIFILISTTQYYIGSESPTSFYILFMLSVLAKKVWIIYLLSLVVTQKKADGLLECFSGFAIFGANFRESYSPDDYFKRENSYWRGIVFSAVFILIIILFSELAFSRYPFSTNEFFRLTISCRDTTLSAPKEALFYIGRDVATICFFQNEVLFGIIKHIMIDSMIFYIAPLMMGYQLPMPYGNFFKATSWNSFMSKMFYFYSLVIYRIFIVEFYKLLLDVLKKRHKLVLPAATFLGVAVGAFFFHIIKDYLYAYEIGKNSIFTHFFSWLLLFYFGYLAITATIDSMKIFTSRRVNKVLIILFFLGLLVGRSFYGSYRAKTPVTIKVENIKNILGL